MLKEILSKLRLGATAAAVVRIPTVAAAPDEWATIPNDWSFSNRQRIAIQEITTYKAMIRGDRHHDNSKTMTILIPMNLRPEEYVEIGYLISKIATDDFPQHYSRFGFTTDAWNGVENPTIRFLDVVPPGHYRVKVRVP